MTYQPYKEPMKTAFGDAAVAENTPQVQVKFPYGINTEIAQVLTNNASSTVTSTGGYAKITCAGTANAFSQIRTKDTLRYGPGQGAVARGTYAWVNGGFANSSHVFGPGDDDEGYFFGFNGTSFGVLRRDSGSLEIKSLTVTSGAVTATGNITVTLDGTAVVVAVTSGDTIAQVVEKIVAEADNFFNAGRGWETHTDDDNSIEFISLVAENAAGSFTFVDTDTTGVAASFSETINGVAPNETWVAQASWNKDVMDGTGPSGMTLDTTKLNVLEVRFQYLGAGAIDFCIEDSETGQFVIAHTIKYANTAQVPSVVNPTFYLTAIAKTETGYAGSAIEGRTASMAGFIQGPESNLGVRHSISATKTATASQELALMIHNEIDFQSKVNRVMVYPDFITITTDASKPVEVIIKREPSRVDGGVVLTDIHATDSVMQYSTTGTTVTNGENLMEFELESGSSIATPLKELNMRLRPGERWVFTVQGTTGGLGDVKIGVTWIERI